MLFLLGFLHLYGAVTLLFSSWTMGYVHDEPLYIEVGQRFLKTGLYGMDFPPFPVWFGVLISYLRGHTNSFDPTTLFESRIPHVLLFILIGLIITRLIWQKAGPWPALVFTAVYQTFPLLKAISSHHLTDLEPTLFLTLVAVLLWVQYPKSPLRLGIVFFILGLACVSKITALLFIPFFLWRVFQDTPVHNRKIYSLVIIFSLLIAIAVGYLFHLSLMKDYWNLIRAKMAHNSAGHLTSLFQTQRDHGYWYYYLVLLFFKSPLPFLALLFAGFYLRLKKNADPQTSILFFWPAVFLLFFLSKNNIQIGLRYLLPAILLFVLDSSLLVGKALTSPNQKKGILFGVFLLVAIDAHTLLSDSYLTYFNAWAPRPALNFSDSNIDWNQKTPRHLVGTLPTTFETRDIIAFLKDPNRDRILLRIGATELNGIWKSPFGVVFRSLLPIHSVTGYEIFDVSKAELFQLLLQKPPLYSLTSGGLRELSQPVPLETSVIQCPQGHTAFLKFDSLVPDLPALLRKVPATTPLKFSRESHLPSHKPVLVVVTTNEAVSLSIDGQLSNPPPDHLNEKHDGIHWMKVVPERPLQNIEMELSVPHRSSLDDRKGEILAFNWDCN